MFTEKYRPVALKDLIQQESVGKLDAWLGKWPAGARAALLHGPPGIGKTTTALCLAKKYGLRPIEINASDTRNAAAIKELFAVQIAGTIYIVDEIDGMSVSDRGGVVELNKAIEKTHVPIICICNDRQSKQARAIARSCLDLRFDPLAVDQIIRRLTEIARTERLPIANIKSCAAAAAGDMRLALNSLQMGATCSVDANLRLDAFTAIQALFKRTGDLDSAEILVSVDYELTPLLAQQYYAERETSLDHVVQAADRFSHIDMCSAKIHSEQAWGLLPYVTVLTAGTIRGTKSVLPHWIQFPTVLAKGSSARAKYRALTDIARRTGVADTTVLRLDYFDMLRTATLGQFAHKSVPELVEIVSEMGLTRDDLFEVLAEIGFNPAPAIATKTKTAFTRAYNKHFSGAAAATAPAPAPAEDEVDEDD